MRLVLGIVVMAIVGPAGCNTVKGGQGYREGWRSHPEGSEVMKAFTVFSRAWRRRSTVQTSTPMPSSPNSS